VRIHWRRNWKAGFDIVNVKSPSLSWLFQPVFSRKVMQRDGYSSRVRSLRWSLCVVDDRKVGGKFRLLYDGHVSECQATMRSATLPMLWRVPADHEIEGNVRHITDMFYDFDRY
jgi:hypothetical protein